VTLTRICAMLDKLMSKKMKIAILVRSFIPSPRPNDMVYAPIDLAVAIAKGLGKRGHEVTLFSPLGSKLDATGVKIETMNLRPLVHNQNEWEELLNNTELLAHGQMWMWDSYMINEMFKRAEAGDFDLLYFHHLTPSIPVSTQHPNIPVVYTVHDPIAPWWRETLGLFSSKNQHFISISNNQRRDAADLPYLDTVYNGTDITLFNFSDEPEDFLLFVGRIAPDKGVKEAIQVARETNHKLLIIGPVNHGMYDYFEQHVKPELDDKILYLGRMDQDQLTGYYQKAKALLTPVQWEEPFGLTTVESMACGTPVISLRRGAAPEIIEDGISGFVVNSMAEMAEAIGKVDTLDRKECRKRVEAMFSHETMVDGYEKAFLKLLDTKANNK